MPSLAYREETKDAKYTYRDYLSWTDGQRYELIDGVVYAMSPSPTRGHQNIVLELASRLREFLKGTPRQPVIAPYDVKLDDHTVVQPDISIWCAPAMAGNNIAVSAHGSPPAGDKDLWLGSQEANPASTSNTQDAQSAHGAQNTQDAQITGEELRVVVEVLSPSTAARDFIKKRRLYEKHQIPEYWIVSPDEKLITRFSLHDGQYEPHSFEPGEDTNFVSEALDGFAFDVKELFPVEPAGQPPPAIG